MRVFEKEIRYIRFVVVLCCFVSVVINARIAKAQDRNVRFQQLTTEQGLSQNMVDCMLQDQLGYMWFGTWNGLCRYDGYEFEYFNKNEAPYGLRNNFIYDLEEDNFGNIWIGTRQGLFVYLYDQKVFHHLRDSAASIHGDLAYRKIQKTSDGQLMVGSDRYVHIIEVKDNSADYRVISKYDLKQVGATEIGDLHKSRDGKYWIGSDNGLIVLDPKGNFKKRYVFDPLDYASITTNDINAIYESSTGELWIGTEVGLNKYFSGLDGFERFYHYENDPNSLVHNTVMDLGEDFMGRLLIGTLGGFSIKAPGQSQFLNYKYDPKAIYGLNNDFINCLLVDRDENVWIGTERGGVNIFNIKQNTIENFSHEPGNENSLSNNTVNSIFEDDDYIWIGTAGGGLNQYDKKTRSYTHYSSTEVSPNAQRILTSDFITAITKGPEGKLWVATWGQGVNLLNKTGNPRKVDRVINYPNDSISSDFVSSLLTDREGNMWIGTLYGLTKYNTKDDSFEDFSEIDGIRITGVGCLLIDRQGDLWIGTRTGLFCLQQQNGSAKITKYVHQRTNENSIVGNYVISLIEDGQGRIWAGTYGQGVSMINREPGQEPHFTSFSSTEGLSNNIVYGLVEDMQGKIWMITDYGLNRLDPQTYLVRNFYVSDGLTNNQYYWSAGYKNERGKIYVGGMNGLDAFYPVWIQDEGYQPKVQITDVKLFGESIIPKKEYSGVVAIENNIAEARQLMLSYKQKMVSIEFSSFNYLDAEVITYAYRLKGFDQQWNVVGANRHAVDYTNLKPGNYTFQVKAAGTNGVFDQHPTSIDIYVLPPIWGTVWFRILAIIIIGLIVLGYVRYRTYNLKKQKADLEREVQVRTKEINQQKEALSTQAVQLQKSNEDLEQKQGQIEGQNQKLESQNQEIATQRDELISLNKRLEHVSQLKLSFFTNISHEFRTPLTLILGPLEKLIKENNLNAEVKNTLNVMNRNAQRLLHLVNQIMDFRKIEKGRMELIISETNISDFFKDMFNAFEPLADIKGMSFEYKEANLPDRVWFDTVKIENVLQNLLSNAFKYTPNKGQIKLEVKGLSTEESRLELPEEIRNDVENIISIQVSDSGAGISDAELPLVFKRFYRIQSEDAFKISGSGIGLALTEELIKTHHGEVFVNSKLGEGSVFEVQFPCLKDSYGKSIVRGESAQKESILQQIEILKNEFLESESDENATEDVALDKNKPTVLVVEDSVDLRNFLIHQLSRSFNVLEAENGQLGLQIAIEKSPDVIISDVMMPKMDGLELCAAIKGSLKTSHIPVILLTAKSAVEDQLEGLQIGADDYLAKPFNLEVLEIKIQNFIESRKKLRNLFIESPDFNVAEATTNNRDQKFLENAIEVVQKHLSDSSFGPKELVEAMGISRSLLHKKLTSLTEQSAAEFIKHLRMKEARNLLRKNEMNISEVAYAVGYNDPKYFSRVFSKSFGQSPKEFVENSK